jgi:hypothetical protein
MTIGSTLQEELLERSRDEDDSRAAALFAVASAICAAGETLAHEIRLLGVGTPEGLGAIEDLARHVGERLAEFTEVLRYGLDDWAAARSPGQST